jgi:hypothetical protein
MSVSNPLELHQYVDQLVKEQAGNKRNLEEYLLALLKQIQVARDKQPTYQDIANFLRDSYTGEPAKYSKDWAKLPVLRNEANTDAYFKEVESYEYVERHLKIYIDDLHYIRTSIRHTLFGGSSVDGTKGRGGAIIWQRTELGPFLLAAVSTLDAEAAEQEPCSWGFLDNMLIDGVSLE